jgi:hypothetical protein
MCVSNEVLAQNKRPFRIRQAGEGKVCGDREYVVTESMW